jgi:hypothetical protein
MNAFFIGGLGSAISGATLGSSSIFKEKNSRPCLPTPSQMDHQRTEKPISIHSTAALAYVCPKSDPGAWTAVFFKVGEGKGEASLN